MFEEVKSLRVIRFVQESKIVDGDARSCIVLDILNQESGICWHPVS